MRQVVHGGQRVRNDARTTSPPLPRPKRPTSRVLFTIGRDPRPRSSPVFWCSVVADVLHDVDEKRGEKL